MQLDRFVLYFINDYTATPVEIFGWAHKSRNLEGYLRKILTNSKVIKTAKEWGHPGTPSSNRHRTTHDYFVPTVQSEVPLGSDKKQ